MIQKGTSKTPEKYQYREAAKAHGRLPMMQVRRFRPVVAVFAILTALVLVASDADARAGRGLSSGSRGARSFTTTAPTTTAPTGGTSLNRTMAQPGSTGVAS